VTYVDDYLTEQAEENRRAAERLAADIELLKTLRQRTVELVADSRAYGSDMSYEFSKLRDYIGEQLAYLLLRRELES
jgi:hypothetical protein